MSRLGSILFLSFIALGLTAHGQVSPYGYGLWGGMQSCPYPTQAAGGATSFSAETKELGRKYLKDQAALKAQNDKLAKLKASQDKLQTRIEKVISGDYADVMFEHIQEGRTCEAYQYGDVPAAAAATAASISCPDNEACVQDRNTVPIRQYKANEWKSLCDADHVGSVNASVACSLHRESDVSGEDASGCREDLTDYLAKSRDIRKMEKDAKKLQRMVEKEKDAAEDAAQADLDKKDDPSRTEGGICIECMLKANGGGGGGQQSQGVNWPSVFSNGITAALAIGVGYQQNKMISQNNAALGYPSQSYPTWGYGLPYAANAIYGALGGSTAQGTYGCGSGMNGTGNWNGPGGMGGPYGQGGLYGMNQGGVFGYPNGMGGNPMSGGMYLPGMSPWGMNGPNSGQGYGGLQAGMMMTGMMPGMQAGGYGMQMGGYGMQMGGYGMQMPGYGMQMGGGGYPASGFATSGFAMGGYPMGNGYAMGGGTVISGYAAMGGYPMSSGYAMGGYPMSSGYAVGGGYGAQMGGYGLGGYPMSGYAAAGGIGSMMGSYQQSQANYYQRQQTALQLQSEVSQLMLRLQSIESGGSVNFGGTTNSYLGGSFGTTGFGNTSIINSSGSGSISPR